MKLGKSKRKGNSYEIKISRILSRWYDKNEETDYFWRTAGSGAKSTVTRRGETSFVGDITFLPSPDCLKIWIDTKDRKEASFNGIMQEDWVIKRWHKEETKKRDNLKLKKPVVIIFKLYRKKEDYIYFLNNNFTFQIANLVKYKSIFLRYKNFYVMKLEDFLNIVERKCILAIENC